MQQKEWKFTDKSSWPRGEWDDEPDKTQWTDETTGLACLIVRNPMGALCGYVGVPTTHVLHGIKYNAESPALANLMQQRKQQPIDESVGLGVMLAWMSGGSPTPEAVLSAHGGLTFSGACSGGEHGICHVVEPGEDENVWWFGFDCAHCDDFIPGMDRRFSVGTEYRNLAYVKEQCTALATQLADVRPLPSRAIDIKEA